ncbi:MAG: hypothetical protein KDC58_02450 [Cyclobacteriaceae bacterium]|nr:hypothetical protein [Cyclobacteriaceae bacterium]
MKLRLLLLLLSVLSLHSNAQKKQGKITSADLAGTRWSVLEIWRIGHDKEPEQVEKEDFGEWNAFVELSFGDDNTFEGTRLNGKGFSGTWSVTKKELHYEFEEGDYGDTYVDAEIKKPAPDKIILTADFCNDGCSYEITYQKK